MSVELAVLLSNRKHTGQRCEMLRQKAAFQATVALWRRGTVRANPKAFVAGAVAHQPLTTHLHRNRSVAFWSETGSKDATSALAQDAGLVKLRQCLDSHDHMQLQRQRPCRKITSRAGGKKQLPAAICQLEDELTRTWLRFV